MCEVIVLVHDRWRVLLSAGMFATKKLWGGKKKGICTAPSVSLATTFCLV
jgi:hypothetical protein